VILLYYFNARMLLQEFPFEPEKAVFPVYREIPQSTTLIRDTIELLIRGEITKQEEELGFITEFPHPGFRLVGLDLKNGGTLVLEFTEIFGFTTGGSFRILVMREQIEKTALQFAAVKSVEFYPESLFQP
jgi:spore germination protein GerM